MNIAAKGLNAIMEHFTQSVFQLFINRLSGCCVAVYKIIKSEVNRFSEHKVLFCRHVSSFVLKTTQRIKTFSVIDAEDFSHLIFF